MMKPEKDYEEFIELLNRHKVLYCIIGSFALAFHARPRYTKDIDILINPTPENAGRLVDVLKEFGFASLGLTQDDFTKRGNIIQLGYEPVRIDIITSIDGLPFEKLVDNIQAGEYGQQTARFIGRADLIKAKRLSNRIQDQADLEVLLDEQEQRG